MKKTSIFTNLSLGLLIAGTMAACKQGPATPAASTAAAPVAAGTEAKELIVYVNSDTLAKNYSYVKDMDKRLTDKSNAAKSDLQSKAKLSSAG